MRMDALIAEMYLTVYNTVRRKSAMTREITDVHEIGQLRERCEHLKKAITQLGDLRQGSLVERYRVCGKPSCHCARDGSPGHGPSWSLTHSVHGKTVTRVIPVRQVGATKQQIAEYRLFRELARELVEINERICQAQLDCDRAGADTEPAKKRASKKVLTKRWQRKLKH